MNLRKSSAAGSGRFLGDRDRGFDLDRRGRDDVFDVFAFVFGLDRLVLVAEQDVALALGEGGERVAGAARLGDGLFEQRLDALRAPGRATCPR